jgi:hypothetical protein
MSITLGSFTPSLSWGTAPALSPYTWELHGADIVVGALDRATNGPEVRFSLPDGSTVSLRVVGVAGGLTASVTDNVLRVGPVTLTATEVDGHLRIGYDLLGSVKPNNNQVSWTVTTTGGASVVMAGNIASIRDARGREQATQPAPSATDRNGADVPVTATLAQGVLTYTLANIANNRYPVSIDPTTVSTSTTNLATRYGVGTNRMFVARDGALCVLYHDGTNLVFRSSVEPYTTWSSATTIAATTYQQYGGWIDLDDDIQIAYEDNSPSETRHVELSYSGGTWTVGTAHTIASLVAGEVTSQSLVRDPSGRLWAAHPGYSGGFTHLIYYSDDNGVTWTQAVADAINTAPNESPLLVTPTHLVQYHGDSGTLRIRRHLHTASAGTWTTGGTSVGTFYQDHETGGFVEPTGHVQTVWSNNGNDYALRTIRYDPVADTWASSVDIGDANSDVDPALVPMGRDAILVYAKNNAANDYRLTYRWRYVEASAWGPKVTFSTTAANRRYPVACRINDMTIGVLWTEGTGSPYNVQFEAVPVAPPKGIENWRRYFVPTGTPPSPTAPPPWPPAYRLQPLLGR